MNRTPVTHDLVRRLSLSLPSFPRVLKDILDTLDDPDANFHVLTRAISLDPLIGARVLWVANTAAVRGRRESAVTDIATATSLAGVTRVRHIAIISSLSTFAAGVRHKLPTAFWPHSVSAGVCCEELAQQVDVPVSSSSALVAGLLHDIGQLWLSHFDVDRLASCWQDAQARNLPIEAAEVECFSVSHANIGAWMADMWGLPDDIVAAIAGHHHPSAVNIGASSPAKQHLVDLIHIGEVLANALDLAGRSHNRVHNLSGPACERLGLAWHDGSHLLFGRVEARSRHANSVFALPPR
jgi:putative nucleotidyltransferase with HDIG domain